MIKYRKGNLLDSEAQALVNTVNTVGVMGKGIALQFKEQYPENYRLYKAAYKAGELAIGKLFITEDQNAFGRKTIINFPTKKHWRNKSQYQYVIEGLKALKDFLAESSLLSIAIPPLGCGNGGLDWDKVKVLMEEHLGKLDLEIIVYEPNPGIKQQLQAKPINQKATLTPARAMLLYALFHYEAEGEEANLFVANKLAYFLQRLGEELQLSFKAHYYGPYTPQIQHVLYYLNGTYLRGLEQQNAKPFEELLLDYSKYEEIKAYISEYLCQEQTKRLEDLFKLIEGFTSAFSLEVLSSVDYIQDQYNATSVDDIMNKASEWSKRKANLLKPTYVKKAQEKLTAFSEAQMTPNLQP